MLREWWAARRRAKVRTRLAAARAGQRAGKRFADGITASALAGCCAHGAGVLDDCPACTGYPIVSTAHAELYEYEEPDDAEPGLRS